MTRKIAFIGPLPPPLGGVAMMNKSFQELEYQGSEIIHFNTSNKAQREDLYKGLPWNNISKEYKKFKLLKAFVTKQVPDVANVFVTSGYSIIRDLFYMRCLYRLKVPVVVHFHSKKKGEFALSPRRIKFVGRLFNKYADKIILLSQDHFNYFTQFFREDKCEILENFVDYSHFDNNLDDKTNEFLYVGRLSKEKGFLDLLKACVLLKNKNILFKINVVGAAPNDLVEQEINEFVKLNKLESILNFHGLKFNEEKFLLFKRSKVLLFPSHFENSPVVLKEGIAAKMAILASDIAPNKNILNNKNNHLLHLVGNPEDLANKIEVLLTNFNLTNDYCKASSKIMEYDKKYANKKLQSILDKLC